MSNQTRATIKTYFNTGDRPTEAQFVDVFDSELPYFASMQDMVDAPVSANADEQLFALKEFYSDIEEGGGVYEWDSSESKANHDGGVIINPAHNSTPGASGWYSPSGNGTSTSGSGCYKRVNVEIVNPYVYGAKGDNTNDDYNAINNAKLYAESTGKDVRFTYGEYRFTQQLDFEGINVDLGNSELHYDGSEGVFAVVFNSDGGSGLDQKEGQQLKNGTIYQDDFSEYTTVSGSTTYDPPSIASNDVITAIGGGGESTTVSVPGAEVGGYARATFTSAEEGIVVTAYVSSSDTVTVVFSNYSNASVDMASGTINVDVVNNAYNGLCLSGILGRTENITIRGFTGIALGMGDGRDPISGISLPGNKGRCFYWDVNANISATAGWNCVIPQRNNVNRLSIGMFPLNAYGDNRNTSINSVTIGGTYNTFTRLNIEDNPSEEALVISEYATNNTSSGPIYREENPSFTASGSPTVTAKFNSSFNIFGVRPHGQDVLVDDDGTGNNIYSLPSFSINSRRIKPPVVSGNLLDNGDFANKLNSWSDFGTNTTLSYVDGPQVTGQALRVDITSGRVSVFQTISDADNGVKVESLRGENITISAFIKTDLDSVALKANNLSSGTTTGDESIEFLSITYKVTDTDTDIDINIQSATGETGYAEIANVTAMIGLEASIATERKDVRGSTSFNPANLADGSQLTTTVSVPGAELGDFTTASFATDLQGIQLTSYVSSDDTVTCVFSNETGGAIDLGNNTLSVNLIKND